MMSDRQGGCACTVREARCGALSPYIAYSMLYTCVAEATFSSSQLHRPQQLRLDFTHRGRPAHAIVAILYISGLWVQINHTER
jgi:hypothetical protein